jgi:hypothetical protein
MRIFYAERRDIQVGEGALSWIPSTKQLKILHAKNATIIAA